MRSHLEGPLGRIAEVAAARGVSPAVLTGGGFVVGLGACVAIANERWLVGLALWLVNRLLDGLDGAVARRSDAGPTELGGFLDIMADFAIYAGIVAAVGFAIPDARVPALVTLVFYYLNGSAFLAWSSLAERRRIGGDGRSLVFPAGLAEGSETIAVYAILLLVPSQAPLILWVWAAVVAITVVQRIVFVRSQLSRHR